LAPNEETLRRPIQAPAPANLAPVERLCCILGALRADSPTRPSSRCAAAAVAPTRRFGLPPEHSAQLTTTAVLHSAKYKAMLLFGPGNCHAAFFVLCRRRRRTHPPARPSLRAQRPVGFPVLRAGVRWAKLWPGGLDRRAAYGRCGETSRRCSIAGGCAAAAAAGGGGGGEREGGLTDFYPPWPLAAICSDVIACPDNYFLSISDSELFHNRSESLRSSNEACLSQRWRHSTAGTAVDAKTHTAV
jgi:hypothetical protein